MDDSFGYADLSASYANEIPVTLGHGILSQTASPLYNLLAPENVIPMLYYQRLKPAWPACIIIQ